MNKHKKSRTAAAGRLLGSSVAALVFAVSPLHAAQTDISSTPITSTSAALVKPNIMLLMDTSDSMSFSHMPDEVEAVLGPISTTDVAARVGYKSSQCNVLYYNPATNYALPKRADGSFFPAPSFTARAVRRLRHPVVGDGQPGHELHAVRQHDPAPRRLDLPADAGLLLRAHRPGDRQLHLGLPAPISTSVRTQPASDGGTWTRVNVGGGHCSAAGQLRDLVHLLPHPDRA